MAGEDGAAGGLRDDRPLRCLVPRRTHSRLRSRSSFASMSTEHEALRRAADAADRRAPRRRCRAELARHVSAVSPPCGRARATCRPCHRHRDHDARSGVRDDRRDARSNLTANPRDDARRRRPRRACRLRGAGRAHRGGRRRQPSRRSCRRAGPRRSGTDGAAARRSAGVPSRTGHEQCTSTTPGSRQSATNSEGTKWSTTAHEDDVTSERSATAAATPSCRDHARSPGPSASHSATLIASFDRSGSSSAAARGAASVVFPLPGIPVTSTYIRRSLPRRSVKTRPAGREARAIDWRGDRGPRRLRLRRRGTRRSLRVARSRGATPSLRRARVRQEARGGAGSGGGGPAQARRTRARRCRHERAPGARTRRPRSRRCCPAARRANARCGPTGSRAAAPAAQHRPNRRRAAGAARRSPLSSASRGESTRPGRDAGTCRTRAPGPAAVLQSAEEASVTMM